MMTTSTMTFRASARAPIANQTERRHNAKGLSRRVSRVSIVAQAVSAPELQRWMSSTQPPQLVDVREQQELELAALPGVVHLPLSGSQQWLPQLWDRLDRGRDLVVLCHAGIRSWQFATWLMETQQVPQVWNLEGGIDAWSVLVDPGVPRY